MHYHLGPSNVCLSKQNTCQEGISIASEFPKCKSNCLPPGSNSPAVPFLARFQRTVLLLASCFLLASFLISCSRSRPEIQEARQFEAGENWEQALAAYNRVLPELKPSQKSSLAEIYSRMGHCLIELGRGTDALASLEKALSLDANNLNAHLRIAQLFVMAEAPQKAESHLAYIANFSPSDPEMLQVRGAMYAAEDHIDLAERDLLRAYDLAPDRDRIAERLAQLYLGEDQPDKARSILTRATDQTAHKSRLLLTLARLEETEGETAAAESTYRKAIAVEDSAENNRRLAQFLARNGKVVEAEKILQKVDAMQPESPTATADLQLQSGRPREALRNYESAYARLATRSSTSDSVKRKPTGDLAIRIIEADLALASSGDSQALRAARVHMAEAGADLAPTRRSVIEAEIALVSGDLPSAERNANDALKDRDNRASVQYLLGVIAARRGQQAEALSHWKAALQANTGYVPSRIMLATDAIDQHDGVKAADYIIDVVRDEPANVDALLLYARALMLQQRYDSARALCQRALAADRNNAQVSIVLGDVALQQRRLAMALIEYEKAMLLEPHSRQAIEGLTAVYQAGGAGKAMLRKLEFVADSGTPSSRLMEIAGRLYASQHMDADATRCLQRAVQIDPERQSVALALAGSYVNREKATAQDLLAKPDLRSLSKTGDAASASLVAALRATRRRDEAEAIREYELAVRAGDRSGIASNNLAWIYAVQGKHLNRALALAQHALELNPGSPQVLDTLGVIQLENRQFTRAIAFFESGVRRASQFGKMPELQHTIEAHLAEARKMAGQPASER